MKGILMNIQEKEKIFEKSIRKLMKKDVEELEKSINSEVETQIKSELQKYEEKEEFAYNKKLEKLEKDYNKQIYNLEIEHKKEILNYKKEIQNNLRTEIENSLKNFVNTKEYEDFLMNRIDEVLKKVTDTENVILGLTEVDFQKYKIKYNINVKIIDDKYIGGCTLEDNINGIYIDNTILNSINEHL